MNFKCLIYQIHVRHTVTHQETTLFTQDVTDGGQTAVKMLSQEPINFLGCGLKQTHWCFEKFPLIHYLLTRLDAKL